MADGPRWSALALGVVVLATTVAGGALVLQRVLSRPKQQATVSGLFLQLDRAEWLLDQMDHGQRYPMPQSMMPDLPPHGVFRLTVEVGLHNPSPDQQEFRVTELFFRSSERGMWPATGGELTDVTLNPGQALNMFTNFDVAESEIAGDLRLLWVREGNTVQMLAIPHPPEHDHDEEEFEAIVWPEDVTDLPEGDPAAGEQLFMLEYGCVACHGHPGLQNSHTVGPHLGGIAAEAGRRVPGVSAAQYLYESIVEPDAFIAPECKDRPCDSPSAMPPFGELLRPQEMRDLVAYLESL